MHYHHIENQLLPHQWLNMLGGHETWPQLHVKIKIQYIVFG
jgi:hypothetical protein